MKRTLLISLAAVLILLSFQSNVHAQKGERTFRKAIKQVEKGKYSKAGYTFIKAYGKGYYPEFESLTYAALAFNAEGNSGSAGVCFRQAAVEAFSFATDYQHRYHNIPWDADTVFFRDVEEMYASLYTIADTTEFWKQYELKDEIDLLLYVAANVYADESSCDTAIYYANLGLKYNADPDLYSVKGDCWLELGQSDSAFLAYATASQLAPDDASALTGMGEALEQLDEYEKAMQYYDRALEVDPSDIYTLYCKGYLFELLFNYDQALEFYSRVLEADPSYYIAYYNRGGVYFELNDYEPAIADYRKYLEFVPGDEDALYNIQAAEENLWNGY